MTYSDVIDVLDCRRAVVDLREWQARARTPGERANVKRWADGTERRLQTLLRERDSLLRDLGQALIWLQDELETNERLRDEVNWLRDELNKQPKTVPFRYRQRSGPRPAA